MLVDSIDDLHLSNSICSIGGDGCFGLYCIYTYAFRGVAQVAIANVTPFWMMALFNRVEQK